MATKLRVLLPFLVAHTASSSGVDPVVLLPGNTCSQIEARLTEAYEPPSLLCELPDRWFRLWKNNTAPQSPSVVPCLADELRLVYDNAAGDCRNAPSVETRLLSFGSTRGFLADNLADKELCLGSLVEALERAGYRDGETLFGAHGGCGVQARCRPAAVVRKMGLTNGVYGEAKLSRRAQQLPCRVSPTTASIPELERKTIPSKSKLFRTGPEKARKIFAVSVDYALCVHAFAITCRYQME